ncbi:MAG: hypothetical protein ABUT20_66300 [Bacteroidota bacterium]
MKSILSTFLLFLCFHGYSQNIYEINLSKGVNETRMGLWTSGDYHVFIELDVLESWFLRQQNSFMNSSLNFSYGDTAASSYYDMIAKRYEVAAMQLKSAKSEFDLRKLVIYYGAENEIENSGNSVLVEEVVKQLVES